MSDNAKCLYYVVETVKDAPAIRGHFELFVVPAGSIDCVLQEYVDENEELIGRCLPLSITPHAWTDAEYEAYCYEHEIELTD